MDKNHDGIADQDEIVDFMTHVRAVPCRAVRAPMAMCAPSLRFTVPYIRMHTRTRTHTQMIFHTHTHITHELTHAWIWCKFLGITRNSGATLLNALDQKLMQAS
jgi:hypothetical protein